MVAIEEVEMDTSSESKPLYEEKILDAEELEKLSGQIQRPSAKKQVELLVKKIRDEASALKAAAASSSNDDVAMESAVEKKIPAPAPVPVPVPLPNANLGKPVASPSAMYKNIDTFAFDAGTSSDKFVTLYLPLPGVGSVQNKAEQIKCDFQKDNFDVKVFDLNGKNYRLMRDNLEHDIVPELSKRIVKADKIIVKLHKVKGEYGSFDFWSKLTDPKRKEKKSKSSSANPTDGLMDMMKEMYDSGDDKMKKIIGETMMKQRNGELNNDKLGGGLGDMDNFED